MIRRILALIAVFQALTSTALAQEVSVRTAEHNDFTRIVLDFVQRPLWQLGRVGSDYELQTDAQSLVFDLGDVYRRLYSGRLIALDQAGDGTLRIRLGCDCRLSTEELSNGGLVIDILDGAPPPDDPFQTALGPGARAARPPISAPPRPAPPPQGALPVDLSGGLSETAPTVLPLESNDEIRSAAAELQAGLVGEIRRAADLDLVTLSPNAPPPRDAVEPPMDMAQPDGTSEVAPDRVAELSEGPNIRIKTEAESALDARDTSPRTAEADASRCARYEALLSPADWVREGDGPGDIALERIQLVDMLGVPSARGFENLTEAYLYLTFGREAEATLAAAPQELGNRDLYLALARIVDNRPLDSNPLAGLTSCPGNTGLWARLAEADAPSVAGDVTRPAAFADWPVQLRRTLGPRLAEAYLTAGDTETARAIFRAIARVSVPDDPAFLMLASRFAEEGNDPATMPVETMADVAVTRSPESVPALLGVIDARIDEDVPVGTDLAMQAGALAFELATRPEASQLRGAEIRALIHDGHYRAAVARLDAEEVQEDRGDLLTSLVSEMTVHADDADLLWVAARMEGVPGIEREARRAMAHRILSLGLSDLARASLGLGAALPTRDDRRLLAGIALLEERPDTAEAYIAGLTAPEDLAIRERIAEMRLQASVFPSEDGTGSGPVVDPGITSAPDKAILPAIPIEDLGLQQGRRLLSDSEALRNDVEQLLLP